MRGMRGGIIVFIDFCYFVGKHVARHSSSHHVLLLFLLGPLVWYGAVRRIMPADTDTWVNSALRRYPAPGGIDAVKLHVHSMCESFLLCL